MLVLELTTLSKRSQEAMGNLVKVSKKKEEDNLTHDVKLKIKQLEPDQLIEQDNSSAAFTFQHLRGNKLVTCKRPEPPTQPPKPSRSASFKLPQVMISASPQPGADAPSKQNQSFANDFKSFSCCSYQSFRDETERSRTNLLLLGPDLGLGLDPFSADSKITFEAIKKLNEPLGRKKVEIVGREVDEREGNNIFLFDSSVFCCIYSLLYHCCLFLCFPFLIYIHLV